MPIIDYAEILRDSEAFDGKEVRVAGRIASFTTNSDEFTFRDRLGFLSIASDFEVRLSQRFSYGEDIWDYYVKNQYVLVQGIWSHSTSFPELRNAEVIATGEEARQADQAFTDAWKAEKSSYSNLPITDYMDLAETPGNYLGQRVRTVGQIQSVGTNAVAQDKYISFGSRDYRISCASFSLQGCPPDMQEVCVEGEYVVLSCLVSEGSWGSIEILDCFVECVGEEAEALSKQADIEWWERFFTERESYIAACQQYSYDEAARYPDACKGKQTIVNGTVIQMDAGYSKDTVYLDVGQGRVVCVEYSGKLPADPEILKGDQISFYGKYSGRTYYTPVEGTDELIPLVDARYSSFNQSDIQ